ncbi:MAG: hypothetical protein K8R02_06985 [Anaerohalosphaeraceae bacterium]|nr:hypothetical protein [Anaerohalosphaeraceae bacterium]
MESTSSGGSFGDDPNDYDMHCSLFFNGACYGDAWAGVISCEVDCNVIGSWSDKTFSGSSNWDSSNNGNWYHYDSSTTILAEFDPNAVPQDCLTEPVVTISDYEGSMYVRPKNGGCCKPSFPQTISISCIGASHTKVTITVDGDSEIGGPSAYAPGCNGGTHSNSGYVTIEANHDRVMVAEDDIKIVIITYTVDFYDYAGNEIDTGTVSVTLTTECPEEPSEGGAESTNIYHYRMRGGYGHEGLLVNGQDYDYGPAFIEGSPGHELWGATYGLSPWPYNDEELSTAEYEWKKKLKKKKSGSMFSGGRSISCKCANISDIKRCINEQSASWNGSRFIIIGHNCRTFVNRTKKKCCLSE